MAERKGQSPTIQRDKLKFEVAPEQQGQRLDRFLVDHFSGLSRAQLQRQELLASLRVNQKSAKSWSQRLQLGDQVEVEQDVVDTLGTAAAAPTLSFEPARLELEILFEDNDLIVINKPPGITVHPGAGTKETTLVEGIWFHILQSTGHSADDFESLKEHAIERPGVVHRLDKDTSGVMVFAKNLQAHQQLSAQFAAKSNQRSYLAVVASQLPQPSMDLETWHFRHPHDRVKLAVAALDDPSQGGQGTRKRKARTQFKSLATYASGSFSLLQAVLSTGRTHQIRLHAAYLGCPVIGDQLYGRKILVSTRSGLPENLCHLDSDYHLLHARQLGFRHPRSGQLVSFEGNLPEHFEAFLLKYQEFRD